MIDSDEPRRGVRGKVQEGSVQRERIDPTASRPASSFVPRPMLDLPEPGSPAPTLESERDQLRFTLQMVLDSTVYDGAGRVVTVQNTLRGHLANRVRMVLGRRSVGHPVE